MQRALHPSGIIINYIASRRDPAGSNLLSLAVEKLIPGAVIAVTSTTLNASEFPINNLDTPPLTGATVARIRTKYVKAFNAR